LRIEKYCKIPGRITIVPASAGPLNENTLAAPTMVSPKTEMVKFSGTIISRLVPGNTLMNLNIPTTGN
jgi:hypothetical protein